MESITLPILPKVIDWSSLFHRKAIIRCYNHLKPYGIAILYALESPYGKISIRPKLTSGTSIKRTDLQAHVQRAAGQPSLYEARTSRKLAGRHQERSKHHVSVQKIYLNHSPCH